MNFDDIQFDLDEAFAKLRERAKWIGGGFVAALLLTWIV